ncbi:hypothetical protein K437DRAFT_224605 [Tilletiaria anomala UBC 951]|uniref:quinol--cytochrome-c reductase n=1 Tax=Tilletiaria anomala (strain ATCC 24038 / CBS 436.72 / UBC 951) TaxID=1037660 RepID=A0A066W1F8_TILAU|nr:uncharacterized protein K437DRAFT_224605 [Tilletiaria anomala UBC 951]KDN44884.1 hypothetical protein K437DRAFT_224605 [Tilletiaria anomala UBC 951]
MRNLWAARSQPINRAAPIYPAFTEQERSDLSQHGVWEPLADYRTITFKSAQARFASTQAAPAQPFLASRTAVAGATALTLGSIALYTQVYGELPFLPVAHANAKDEGLHPPHYPWSHSGIFDTFDHASIRRGYQVYREVCSSCHSLNRVAWRNLVGVSHTVDEVKAMAEEVEYEDGPNDNGDMFQRPGKLADYMPPPYANDEQARAGNGGALPPDLSLITKARHGGADYIFSLLTGYTDAPAGVEVPDGMHYNSYFPGTQIAMARVLYTGLVEYEDGTPATASQMAKDVVTFLNWSSEPEHDQRKKMGFQASILLASMLAMSVYVKRYKWAAIKTRKVSERSSELVWKWDPGRERLADGLFIVCPRSARSLSTRHPRRPTRCTSAWKGGRVVPLSPDLAPGSRTRKDGDCVSQLDGCLPRLLSGNVVLRNPVLYIRCRVHCRVCTSKAIL